MFLAETRMMGVGHSLAPRTTRPRSGCVASTTGGRSSIATFGDTSGRLAGSKGEEGTWEPGTQEVTRKERDELVSLWYQNKGKDLGALLSSLCVHQPVGARSSQPTRLGCVA